MCTGQFLDYDNWNEEAHTRMDEKLIVELRTIEGRVDNRERVNGTCPGALLPNTTETCNLTRKGFEYNFY